MTDILIPVSPGEIVDKLTILEIKKERIKDEEKVNNVCIELEALETIWQQTEYANIPDVLELRAELKEINEKLWDIEDQIRVKEARREFGHHFVELARAVYLTNDERAMVKKEINVGLGSRIIEEKSYEEY